MVDVCGVILAGGQSRRMGQPKELLDWGGKPLLLHLAESIRAAGLPCLVVANERERLPIAQLEQMNVKLTGDLGGSFGPISGIVAAFLATPQEALLVVSCDLPFVDCKAVAKLAQEAEQRKEWDGLVTESDGRFHPLFGVYHRRSLPSWLEALELGDYRVQNVLQRLRLQRLPENLLDSWAFFNVNTPQEYQAALAEKAKREAQQL